MNKNSQNRKVGLYGEIYSGFADFLRQEGFEPISLDSALSSSDTGNGTDIRVAVVDFITPNALAIVDKLITLMPQTSRILVMPEGETISSDPGAFALVHRPFTSIELIDVIRWACDIREVETQIIDEKKEPFERKQLDVLLSDTAQELLLNSQWLNAIFENLPLGLLLFSPKGEVVRANDVLLKTFGLNSIPKNAKCNEIIPWRDTEGDECRVEKCLSENRTLRDVLELPEGRFLEVIHIPVKTERQVSGVLMIVKDISEEVCISDRFEAAAQVIDEGIAIIDPELNLIWANDVLKDWFDIPDDYSGRPCYEVTRGKGRICQGCTVPDSFADGQVHRSYQKLDLSIGKERTFEVISGPVKNNRGKVIRVVRIIRDVTDREKIIQVLAETKDRLEDANAQLSRRIDELAMLTELSEALQTVESLDENMHIFLTAVTAKQGCGFNRAFLFLVNKENKALEGRWAIGPSSPEEAGRIWRELESKPANFAEALANYREVLKGGDVEVNRIIKGLKYPLSDNSTLLINVLDTKKTRIIQDASTEPGAADLAGKIHCNTFAVVPLLAMGKPVGLVVADNMVTGSPINEQNLRLLKAIASHASFTIERSLLMDQLSENYEILQETYDKLQNNQELLIRAERFSAIGRLAAQVAHEIRNPLVAIGGFARNIAKHSEPESDIRKYARIICEEARRLESILQDILSYSSFTEPRMKPVSLDELLETSIEIFREETKESNIEVITIFDPNIDTVQLDPDQIRQVFLNLIKNAVSAMPEGGRLTVATRKTGGFVWVDVTDTGKGIPDDVKEKVFEPFFTTKSSGTGLGLSICYQIIESHGGMIWFTTTENKGTTFHVKLPSGEKTFKEE